MVLPRGMKERPPERPPGLPTRLHSHVPSGQAASGQGLTGRQRSGPPSLGDGPHFAGQSRRGAWVPSRQAGMLSGPGSLEFLKPGSGCGPPSGRPWKRPHGARGPGRPGSLGRASCCPPPVVSERLPGAPGRALRAEALRVDSEAGASDRQVPLLHGDLA